MAYRFRSRDRSVGHGVRRIARTQIDLAIAAIDQRDELEQAVHEVRKRCKKLRGLIRLVRPVFPSYQDENAAFRDAGRMLADLREARVLQLTYDDLIERFEKHIDRRRMGQIRRRLTSERKDAAEQGDIGARVAECRKRLVEARERVKDWEFKAKGWSALAPGLIKTYGRAMEAAETAREDPSFENYHALRKRIKYHWYHTRLLRNVRRDQMGARAKLAKEISDILGKHHDLAVFDLQLRKLPTSSDGEVDVEIALVLARRQRVILEERVWPLIDRLLSQSAEGLADHWGELWEAWRG